MLSNARQLVLPRGIAASAFPSVQAVLLALRLLLDLWQLELAKCIEAIDEHGLYAADTVVISICRQAGKTFLIGCLVFADCIKNPGTTTVWTAHRFKVSRETFNELRALAKSPLLAPHIDYDEITTAAGNECIPFRNGSRIIFAARERGAIRGFTKVRRLILDEAQILSEAAMADLVPTTNQAENPQIILMGTPPKPTDPGEVFTTLRAEAMAGETEGVLYVEFSADPLCDSDDWAAVAEANPSYPMRTGKRAILRMRKLLTNDDDYRREGLGIWDDLGLRSAVISAPMWAALAESPDILMAGYPVFALEMTEDQSTVAIVVAGMTTTERTRVEVAYYGTSVGVVDELARMVLEHEPLMVIVDPKAPAGSLIPLIRKAGINLTTVSAQEFAQACGGILNAATEGKLSHLGDSLLTDAVRVAKRRNLSDAWAWDRLKSPDITCLVAATLAAWGISQSIQATAW